MNGENKKEKPWKYKRRNLAKIVQISTIAWNESFDIKKANVASGSPHAKG